jgi:PAS domain S-box-containing protein
MIPPTLLIVEDDGILAANLEAVLTELGYGVLGPVSTGEAALALLEQQPADLVLMDIELDGALNGIETAAIITGRSDVPIVFLSGFSQDPLLEQAKSTTPYGYLIKPVPERELAATVALSLHRHALDRQLRESRAALAQSEARYRHLFEDSPLGIFRTTVEGRPLLINAEMARMLGFASPEEALSHVHDLKRQLYVDPGKRDEFLELLRTRGEVRNFVYQGRKKNGEYLWISMDACLNANGVTALEHGPVIDGFAQDITARRKAEAALQESLEQHRHYLQSTPYGVFAVDQQGRYLQVNPAACQITGYSEGELLNMSISDLLFPEDRAAGQDHFESVLCQGSAHGELAFRTKTGEKRWWAITAVKAADGRYLGFCNDITERRKAESALKREVAERRILLDNIQTQVWYLTDERTYGAVNQAHAKFTGLNIDRMAFRPMAELFPPDVVTTCHQGNIAVFASGRPLHTEEWIPNAAGERRLLSILKSPVKEANGTVSYVVCSAEDVTERKNAETLLGESEARYRELVENANSIILRMDREGRLLFFNEYAQRFFGYSAEEVLGRSVADTIMPRTDSPGRALQAFIADIGQHPELYATSENENMLRDGTRVWISWTNKPLYSETGEVKEILCVGNDITERRRAEQEKRQLQSQLLHAQKLEAIGTLAGGIAHDFNNILAAIIGYADIAKDEVDAGTPLARDLDQILKAGHRAKDLVKQILTFSRQAEDQPVSLYPATIIKEAVKLLRPALPAIIAIHTHIEDKAGPVRIDPTQMHQMLMNLCTNAFHAMEDQGGKLDIRLQRVELDAQQLAARPSVRPGTYIELVVGDTGSGIPDGLVDRIFDPFFTTKELGKGTGMGLSIVHGIVTRCEGFVTVDSVPGQGTTFHVFLPVAAESQPAPVAPDESLPHGSGHILFIDDEEMLVSIVKIMLERLGYVVTARTSSLEALTTFQNQPDLFDLVITDLTMPGMTGLDLSRRLLQIRPDLPIILCTGFSTLVTEEKARALGIRALAYKPLTKKDMAPLINSILHPKPAG